MHEPASIRSRSPSNIPQIETRTLKDVLDLPWVSRSNSLLTRWNPLNLRRPIPRPTTGRTVLVVGLGRRVSILPSSHDDGHAVVGIDGLKIEPLPVAQSGVAANGTRQPFVAFCATRETCARILASAPWRASVASPSTASPSVGNKNFLKDRAPVA